MLPGFTAEESIYNSRNCYVGGSGQAGMSGIAPAARASSAEGVIWGILLGAMGGYAFGGWGAVVGGIIGGLYCLFVGGCEMPDP